jgi:putative hydrolase of the HAD superfamily
VSPLRAVLFDIDDTLFSTSEFARKARTNAVRAMVSAGLDVPEEVVQRELDEVIAEFSSNYEHHFERLLQRLPAEATRRVNPALIVAAGVAAYHDTKFREIAPFPDVLPLLAALKKARLRVGVITHGLTVKQAEKLVRLGLVPYLDRRRSSSRTRSGSASRTRSSTGRAARARPAGGRGDVRRRQPEHDIAPPQSVGMRTVWARRSAKPASRRAGSSRPRGRGLRELARILKERYGVG